MASKIGIVFDIDGVLVRGPTPIPGAKEALEEVERRGIPHVFLTNNGMQNEAAKASKLEQTVGVPVPAPRMILCQTPLKAQAASLKDALVLVTGHSLHPEGAPGLMRELGFTRVMTMADYARLHPVLLPNKKRTREQLEAPAPPCAGDLEVGAIVLVETPTDWHEDLQVMVDVLRSSGRIGEEAPEQRVPLYVCNFDFTFAWAAVSPRFGPGAFLVCLEALYEKATGRKLQYHSYGKPHLPAYQYAEQMLAEQLPGQGSTLPPNMNIYAIGDNPTSDVRGANAAGGHWHSVLVRSGVFDGSVANDPDDPADFVVDDVGAAIHLILQEAEKQSRL